MRSAKPSCTRACSISPCWVATNRAASSWGSWSRSRQPCRWAAAIRVARRWRNRCMQALPVSLAGLVAGRCSSANNTRTRPGCCWSRPAWLAIRAATCSRGPDGGRAEAPGSGVVAAVAGSRQASKRRSSSPVDQVSASAQSASRLGKWRNRAPWLTPMHSAMAAVLIASGAVVRARSSSTRTAWARRSAAGMATARGTDQEVAESTGNSASESGLSECMLTQCPPHRIRSLSIPLARSAHHGAGVPPPRRIQRNTSSWGYPTRLGRRRP